MGLRDAMREVVGKVGEAVAARQHSEGLQALVRAFADPDRDKRRATADGLKAQLAPLEARLSPERWASLMGELDAAAESGTSEALVRELKTAESELAPAR